MTKKSEITQKNFDRLLLWLDPDKEAAARKYRSIHYRLTQIFIARDIFPPEEFADRAMDIGVQKIDDLMKDYQGDRALFFYGVANNLAFDYARERKNESLSDAYVQKEAHNKIQPEATTIDPDETYFQHLKKCLRKLSSSDRHLLIKYFQYKKKSSKSSYHKKMAEKLGIGINALRNRVYRSKKIVEECVAGCFEDMDV